MKPVVPKPQRCAIYTRKSTEHNLDLEFNSLDAQREACEAYIKSQAHEGWRLVPDRYDDGGLSGASLDRPALQNLLANVRAGNINTVVGLQGRSPHPLARRLRQAGRVVRSTVGLVRVDHPVVQHHVQHGPAHAQRAALLCPV
jgi:DNA invertase Pin-like site-specific DNA recombinase